MNFLFFPLLFSPLPFSRDRSSLSSPLSFFPASGRSRGLSLQSAVRRAISAAEARSILSFFPLFFSPPFFSSFLPPFFFPVRRVRSYQSIAESNGEGVVKERGRGALFFLSFFFPFFPPAGGPLVTSRNASCCATRRIFFPFFPLLLSSA